MGGNQERLIDDQVPQSIHLLKTDAENEIQRLHMDFPQFRMSSKISLGNKQN